MDEGLVLEEMMPVALEPLGGFPDAARLARINEANDWFLRAHFVLQDAPEIDEHDAVQLELRRLDLKLNLLLALVGDLLSRQGSQPEAQPVRLTPDGIRVRVPGAPPRGHWVLVSLFLNPVIPRPLQLPGVVEAEEGEAVAIAFAGLSQPVKDSLEKFIFRQHRKAVAQSRARG